jgi:N-acetyl sugar amidotransferase
MGICSHCRGYDALVNNSVYLSKRKAGALEELADHIRRRGKGKRYDCVIGVSGGVDSTYVAYMAKKLDLRPLAVHLDNGWDSELAVSNVKKALSILNIDLLTHVVDWEEFRDLQLSFLKASTPDSEIPTDHAILALFYEAAVKENVSVILSGHNTATESIGSASWSQGHGDFRYIRSIQKRFGNRKIKSLPHFGPIRFFYYTAIKTIKWYQFLDYLEYDKQKVMDIIQKELGWQAFCGKHYESIYTRFYQGYILPTKFGFDKRRAHLSSLIVSGQISREQALDEMSRSDYPVSLQDEDKKYVIKKLQITEQEFEQIMNAKPMSFWDYPSYKKLFHNHKQFMSFYHSLKRTK